MLAKNVYANLVKFSNLRSVELGRKLTFSETENELLKRVHFEYFIKETIRDYILTFIDNVTVNSSIIGIALFGSVVSNSYDKYSDIDLAILSTSEYFDTLSFVSDIIEDIEPQRKRLLKANGLYLNINPFILGENDLNIIKPIYFEIADFGIILFERKLAFSQFLNSILRIQHKRTFSKEGEMIEWKT